MMDHDIFLSGYEKGYKEGKDETYRYQVRRHKEMGKFSEEIADILSLSVHEVEKYEKEIEQEIRSWQSEN